MSTIRFFVRLNLIIGLFGALIVNTSFAGELKVSEINVATITNSAEPVIYHLDAGLNAQGDIITFIKRVYSDRKLLASETKIYPLSGMRMGILVEKLGFKVLKYDPTQFSSHKGGVIKIYYATDFLMSRFSDSAYNSFNMELVRNGDSWKLFTEAGEEINDLAFKIEKNFLGVSKGISGLKLTYKIRK